MTLTTDYVFATDPFIAERAAAALTRLAVAALHRGRPDTSNASANDRTAALTRYAYAGRVIGSAPEAQRGLWAVATSDDPACVTARTAYAAELAPDDVTDDLLLAAFAAVWDALAGV